MTAAYSPAALDEQKKKIAKKAIQRDLLEKCEWNGNPDEGFQGAGFAERLPPVNGPTGTVRLTYQSYGQPQPVKPPPGAVFKSEEHPEMGGYPTFVYEVDPWTSIYEPWIDRIDSAFQGWDSLPDPGEYDSVIQHVRTAVTSLTPEPDPELGNLGTQFADVDLTRNLGLVAKWLGPATEGADSSQLVYAFDAHYGADVMKAVMHNQSQVAMVLGISLLGEQRIWAKTRGDIMHLAEEAEKAFDVNGGGGHINLDVVNAFIGLVDDFVSPKAAEVLTKVSDGLGLVQKLKPEEHKEDPKPEISGHDADAIYVSMCYAVSKLDMTVYEQEIEIKNHTLQGLLEEMHTQKPDQFHIHPEAGVDDDLRKAEGIKVHPQYLKQIGYQAVPSIAAVMARASQEADGADKAGIWQRGGFIGNAPTGPYEKWQEVLVQFDAVTTGSAKELVEAGALLAHGAGFLQDTDGYAHDALKGVEKEVNSGKDGWDNSKVGVAPPSEHLPHGPGGHVFAE